MQSPAQGIAPDLVSIWDQLIGCHRSAFVYILVALVTDD